MKRILLSIICCSPLYFASNFCYSLDSTDINDSLITSIEQYGPVKSSETLWAVSSKLRPDNSVSVQQTLLAIYKLNPNVFNKGNINQFKPQSIIEIPSLDFIQMQTNQEALNFINSYASNNKKKSAAQLQVQIKLVEQSLTIGPQKTPAKTNLVEQGSTIDPQQTPVQTNLVEQGSTIDPQQTPVQTNLVEQGLTIDLQQTPVQNDLVEQSVNIEPQPIQEQITITELNNIAEQSRLAALEQIDEQARLAELEEIETQAQIEQQAQQALLAEYLANKQTLSVTQENLKSLQDELSLVNQQLITMTATNQAMQSKIAPFISEINDLKVQIENDTQTNEKLIEIIEQYKVKFSANESPSFNENGEVNNVLGWISSSVTNLLLIIISPLLLLSLLFVILLRRNSNKVEDEPYHDESSVQFNRSTFFNMDELNIDRNTTNDQQGDFLEEIKQKETLDASAENETVIQNSATQIDSDAKKSPIDLSDTNASEKKQFTNAFTAELSADIEELQLTEKQTYDENGAIQIDAHSEDIAGEKLANLSEETKPYEKINDIENLHFTDKQAFDKNGAIQIDAHSEDIAGEKLANLSEEIQPYEKINDIENLHFTDKQTFDENGAIQIDAHSEDITGEQLADLSEESNSEKIITDIEDLQSVKKEVSNSNKALQDDTESDNERVLLALSEITQLQQKQLGTEQKANNELYIELIDHLDEGQNTDDINEQAVSQSDPDLPFSEVQSESEGGTDNTSYFELISDIQHLLSADSAVSTTAGDTINITAENELLISDASEIEDLQTDVNVTNLFKDLEHHTNREQSNANETDNNIETLKIDTISAKEKILFDISDISMLHDVQSETVPPLLNESYIELIDSVKNLQLDENTSIKQTLELIDNIEDLQLNDNSIDNQTLKLVDNIEDLQVDISLTNNDDFFDPNSLDYLTDELSNSKNSSLDIDEQQLHQQGNNFISIEKLLEDDQTVDGEEPYSEFDINLGLDAFPDMLNHAENIDIDDDQHGIAAQLDLARAYLEIDDKSNAKKILISAVEHSNGEQRNEIDNLLMRLK